jgi:MinD-like ATPase involved in chromosome partitioning or flagellar assembly
MMDIPFLGSIPLDQDFSEAADTGVPIVELNAESITAKAFVEIARNVSSQLPPKEMEEAPVMESKPCPGSSHGHGHDHDHEGHGHHHH